MLVKAASANEIKKGHGKVVSVNGQEIAIFNVDGKFYATTNVCPHEGGPLGEGMLADKIVTCPWHGWRIDVTTGKHATIPNVKAKTYKVAVKGDDIFVDI